MISAIAENIFSLALTVSAFALEGVGCEIWVKVDGPPPTSEKDCTFLSLDTKSPYVADFEATEANKTAHYMLRWQLRDGSKGTFGETVSATITA